jgi:glycosyltransferase involved in cell wall biosynthesis
VTAVTELVACLGDAGVPSAIAVPEREAAARPGPHVVPAPVWRVPRGPVIRRARSLPLPEPVVVHVHGLASLVPWSPFLWTPRAGAVVGTLHGVLDHAARAGRLAGPRGFWHRHVDLPLLARLSAVHVTRPSEVESARAAGVSDVTCLPWTLRDAAPLRAAPSAASPFVLAVGRLHPIKGLDRLLRVFEAARRAAPRLRLLLAGTGDRRHVEGLLRAARAASVRDAVELLGPVGSEALRACYAEASALALASRYENFGMVVLEALREGCPVLASRETPWEALAQDGAGRLADFDAPEEAAGALLDLLRDPAARGAARACYERRFAPSRVVPSFREWYERVARGTRAVSAA